MDLNAKQAAIRAGYSPRSAKTVGPETLAIPAVRARVDAALAERSRRTGINADRVLQELARVAFINSTNVINFADATLRPDATPDDTAAIASVKVKTIPTDAGYGVEREIRFADKLKALELLGRHLGMFTDNVRLSVDPVQIIDNIPREDGNG